MIMAMVVRDRRVKIVVKGNVKEEEEEVNRVRGVREGDLLGFKPQL